MPQPACYMSRDLCGVKVYHGPPYSYILIISIRYLFQVVPAAMDGIKVLSMARKQPNQSKDARIEQTTVNRVSDIKAPGSTR